MEEKHEEQVEAVVAADTSAINMCRFFNMKVSNVDSVIQKLIEWVVAVYYNGARGLSEIVAAIKRYYYVMYVQAAPESMPGYNMTMMILKEVARDFNEKNERFTMYNKTALVDQLFYSENYTGRYIRSAAAYHRFAKYVYADIGYIYNRYSYRYIDEARAYIRYEPDAHTPSELRTADYLESLYSINAANVALANYEVFDHILKNEYCPLFKSAYYMVITAPISRRGGGRGVVSFDERIFDYLVQLDKKRARLLLDMCIEYARPNIQNVVSDKMRRLLNDTTYRNALGNEHAVLACWRANLSMLRILLSTDPALKKATDNYGNTLLHILCAAAPETTNIEDTVAAIDYVYKLNRSLVRAQNNKKQMPIDLVDVYKSAEKAHKLFPVYFILMEKGSPYDASLISLYLYDEIIIKRYIYTLYKIGDMYNLFSLDAREPNQTLLMYMCRHKMYKYVRYIIQLIDLDGGISDRKVVEYVGYVDRATNNTAYSYMLSVTLDEATELRREYSYELDWLNKYTLDKNAVNSDGKTINSLLAYLSGNMPKVEADMTPIRERSTRANQMLRETPQKILTPTPAKQIRFSNTPETPKTKTPIVQIVAPPSSLSPTPERASTTTYTTPIRNLGPAFEEATPSPP